MHVMTAMTRMRGAQPFLGACVLALAGAVLLAGEAWAQPASGYYLSQESGLNVAPPVELFGNTNDRPSRCDEFINPRFAEVAGCTDPDRGLGAGWKTDYDRAAGMLAGVSAGYRFGGRLRVEAEWFHRESEYDQTSPVASATGDTFDKLGGEIQRAEVRVGSISSHNVFANLYLDFPSASRVTPYVGAGIGAGLVEMDYGDLWTRNPDPAAIVTAAGLPNEAEIRRNLAGTTPPIRRSCTTVRRGTRCWAAQTMRSRIWFRSASRSAGFASAVLSPRESNGSSSGATSRSCGGTGVSR